MATVNQAEQETVTQVPYDPEVGRYESIKLVPFAKATKLQIRTVRREGESDFDWIIRTRNTYRKACYEIGVESDL